VSEHTKEPWDYVEGKTLIHIESIPDGHSHIASVPRNNEANARRIVACVNACAGLDIEILEAITTSFSEEYSDMLKQRDKLLEVLAVITLNATVQPDASMNGSSDIYAVPICDIESARKLIAEVEASK
jgi:hypothetical protein